MFTTRPEILGTFGVVTSTHWLGIRRRHGDAGAGRQRLRRLRRDRLRAAGGRAASGRPGRRSAGGVLFGARPARSRCSAGGTAPAGATIEHYRREGLKLIPGNGLLATVVPGAFDAWMLLLRDHGTDAPARGAGARHLLCRAGPSAAAARVGHDQGAEGILRNRMADLRRGLPAGRRRAEGPTAVPQPAARRDMEAHPARRPRRRAATARRRSKRARDAFYKGFVAEAIDRFRAQDGGDGSERLAPSRRAHRATTWRSGPQATTRRRPTTTTTTA